MDALQANNILMRDILGFNDPDFATAYVTIAYTDQSELDAKGINCNELAMRKNLASLLSERTGTLTALVEAAILTKPQFCSFALTNHLAWKSLVMHRLSQERALIPSFEVAHFFLSYPDSPKFSAACDYVMESGTDVPSEFRNAFTEFFNTTVHESLYQEGKGDEKG
ncbi:hypothetical protein [Photobacterium sanguinicancri]|uniref:hypothetical protein n=1 Tax=Photobacterium sanguinicancri TaxID=875932 RepID=UPI003D1501B7